MNNSYDNLIDIKQQLDEIIEILMNDDLQEMHAIQKYMFKLGSLSGRIGCQIQLLQPLPKSIIHDS